MSLISSLFSLPGDVALHLESKSEPISFSMGEKLPDLDVNPDNLYFLISGSLRHLISSPPDTQKYFTINIHQPPYIFGLCTYYSKKNVEILTAAEDSSLLRISLNNFLELLHQYPSLKQSLLTPVSSSDIWSFFSAHPELIANIDPKELRSCISKIVLHSTTSFYSQAIDVVFDNSKLIFLAENVSPYSFGEIISIDNIQSLLESTDSALRFVEFPSYLLPNSNYSISDLSPISSANTSGLNADSDEILPSFIEAESDKFHDFKFFESSPGVVPEAISCFKTISNQLNLPLKPDLLLRTLEEQSERLGGEVPIQLFAAIAESYGLKTQLLNLPLRLFSRLKVPAIITLKSSEACVVLAVKSKKVLLSRPLYGIQSLTFDDLSVLSESSSEIPVLTLEKTSRTPQKRFDLRWFYPALKKHRRALIEVLVASFFVQLFQLMNPLIIQQIIDKVIGANGINTLPVLAVLLFSFSIFENLLNAVRTNLFIDTTNRIDISLGEQVIDHLLRLPLSYFDKRPVGELSSRLSELEKIRSFLTGTALTVVIDSMFSVLYILFMLFYSWILTIVALLVAPVLALLTFSLSPVIRKQLRTKAELNAFTQNHLIEILTGIQTVKAQNFELKARWKWKDRYSRYIEESYKNAVTSTTANGLTQFFNQASTLSILCVGAYLVLQGQLSLGQLIAFRIISSYVTSPLLRLSGLYQNFQQTLISLERLSDIIDNPPESSELDQKNIPLPRIAGQITYEDVSFRFTNNGPLQLSKISLDVSPGQFVAIVGQSGSGKSTLTKLLTRLYEPSSGRILIDSTDISKVELYSLRSQIGVVPQDSLLFEGSVQDNISLSNPDASSEDIVRAAKVACAHEFIMSLPNGYASPVGERGSSLSGGQRQRIAIARTVLQNPRLLIMDEATSALDYQTERLVSLNLMEHFQDRTVLFITHRLSSITHSDQIVMMHQGQISEIGSHHDLIDLKGRYFALFGQQSDAN